MGKKKDNLDYDTAYEELKNIVNQLQNNEMNIESLSVAIKRAQELKEFCYKRLREIEEDINQTLNK